MIPIVHPGRLLKRELASRALSANRLALDLGVSSGRIADIPNGRLSVTADTAVRLGRHFENSAQFWLDLQSQHDIALKREGKQAMAIIKARLDRKNPPRLLPETKRRLARMSDEQLTANALSDPDNPPLTKGELNRLVDARKVHSKRID